MSYFICRNNFYLTKYLFSNKLPIFEQNFNVSGFNFQRGNVMNHHMNGRGRMQMINWIDAPDDVYFVATEATR